MRLALDVVSVYDVVGNDRGSGMPETCWNCGRPISSGNRFCECGANAGGGSLGSRETILVLTFLVLVAAFVITALAARFYHDRRRDLAEFWFGQGSSDLRTGNASSALSDLQTALIYARQDVSDAQQQAFSLNLAQALEASHRLDEAHAYLLDLWQSTPDSARLNLELAHLSAAMGKDADAQRYYANAIYGIWQGSPEQVHQYQRDTQLEFSRYLLDHNESMAAQSVLLAAAASLPRDTALHIKVGDMMLEAGAPAQALDQYQQALEVDRRNRDALIGAGVSSYDLGNDREAIRYFGQASALKPQIGEPTALPQDATRDLSVATADLSLDFLELGIGPNERAHRAAHAYVVAKDRLESCAKNIGVSLPTPVVAHVSPSKAAAPVSTNDSSAAGEASNQGPAQDLLAAYQQALNMQSSSRETALERNPQWIDPLGKLVFDAESVAAEHCGAPTGVDDAALTRLGARYTAQIHE